MLKKYIILLLGVIYPFFNLTAQDDESWKVYDDTHLAKIYVTMSSADLNWMLANPLSDSLHPCTIAFKNNNIDETVDNVAIRLRGNTSRTACKKSYKLIFNHYVKGKKFHNLKEMNVNGEHNDPTQIRSKLGWDLYKDIGMITPRSSNLELYINNKYYGLYLSVEHIDDEFLKKNFTDYSGNLWKCLSQGSLNKLGDDPDVYKFIYNNIRSYDLKTNKELDDYTQLAHLINVINDTPDSTFYDSLVNVIDIEGLLTYYAMDILTGNWDDFWWGWNNFYLYYNPEERKFKIIPYDIDNTFGIDFDTYDDFATRDPYNWGNIKKVPVLNTRIMANSKLRDLLSHYLKYYSENAFQLSLWENRADGIFNMIAPSVEKDPYKCWGFTNTDFYNSYNLTGYFFDKSLKIHRSVKEFTNVRNQSLLNQLSFVHNGPIIYKLNLSENLLFYNDTLSVNTSVFSRNGFLNVSAIIEYDNGSIDAFELSKDSLSSLTLSENENWYSTINTSGYWKNAVVKIRVEDDLENVTYYPQNGIPITRVSSENTPLFVNEIMSDNVSSVQSDVGTYTDWVELYNSGTEEINLGKKYLTDRLTNLKLWQIPDSTILYPNEYVVFWCDEDTAASKMHTNFKLSSNGEFVALIDHDGTSILDSITFAKIPKDKSYGRNTFNTDVWNTYVFPTPNSVNNLFSEPASHNLIINEVMSTNINTIKDENGIYSDWIEIYNPNDTVVNLSNKFMSDNITYLGQWKFPDSTFIQPNKYMLVWCDGTTNVSDLHTNFKLSTHQEFISLVDVDGYSFIDSVTMPTLPLNKSYGRKALSDPSWYIFDQATPLKINYVPEKPNSNELLITEIMSDNESIYKDENGIYCDWIEIYNPQDTTVSLTNKYLTDNNLLRTKWKFPDSTSIKPKGYLIIWCDDDSLEGNLHTNFKLSTNGEFLGIVDYDKVNFLDSLTFPKIAKNLSYGRDANTNSTWHFFTIPTPGRKNVSLVDSVNNIVLNEVMLSNTEIIRDDFGNFNDWIEIYNPTENKLSLKNLYLTDDKTNLTKWKFPDNSEIDSRQYLLVWCDDNTDSNNYHANFKLNANGEFLILFDNFNSQIIDSVTVPNQLANLSYGRDPVLGDSIWKTLTFPTPGTCNFKGIGAPNFAVRLNEIMSDNISIYFDEFGQFEDWIELFNGTEEPVDISGMYLTDNVDNLKKWRVAENTFIAPEGYLILWCDNDIDQSNKHTNFQLNANGETLVMMDKFGNTIDSVSFPFIGTDLSYSRTNYDWTIWEITKSPTPGGDNIITDIQNDEKILENALNIFPNPFNPTTTIAYSIKEQMDVDFGIFDILGENVWHQSFEKVQPGKYSLIWSGKNNFGRSLASGIYILQVKGKGFNQSVKMMFLK